MQAIILAAGMGRRLGDLTRGNTKCMVKVNGVTLIDRLLRQLSTCKLHRIIIVIGYEGEKLRSYVGNNYAGIPIEYIENPVYDKTNNIYSLALAKKQLQEDDTLLIESDLIFEDSLFEKILSCHYPNIALVDKYQTWMDGTMVCIDEDNNIVDFVSKKAFNYEHVNIYYKTVNLYKFSKSFSINKYVPFLDAYCKALGHNEYYEQVLRVITLLDGSELKAIPLNGETWYEIDDVQDLDIAEALFADKKEKLSKYQKRYGGYWRFPKLLDYCYLVNPFFPPRRMKEEIKANFDTLLTEYPSGMGVNALLAGKYFGVNSQYIVVGNGAAELINSLMSSMKGRMGVVLPTFEEYQNRRKEEDIVSYIPQNTDFSYTAADLKSYFCDKDIEALLLINPDNPSGNYIPTSALLELITWTKEKGIQLIVDESFVDFTDGFEENSLLSDKLLEENKHLIVIKSISKSYGVPGVRLGILASADEKLVSQIKKEVSIWNINSFGEFYMQIFGKYEKDYIHACHKFIDERNRFYSELQKVPFLRVIPSQANYFLCEIMNTFSSEELAERLLNDFNILIKNCNTKTKTLRDQDASESNYIRLAVRNRTDNDYLVRSLLTLSKN